MSKGEVTGSSTKRLKDVSAKNHTIIGYLYPHTPLTLLLAHGLQPYLIRVDRNATAGFEDSLQTFSCAFTRNIFSQRAAGNLDDLDGILFPGNTCDALQNVGDVWRKRYAQDKVLRVTYPVAMYSDEAVSFFAQELRLLSEQIDTIYGRPFSQSDYEIAVTLMNDFREAAQFLYASRILDPAILSYNELVNLIVHFLQHPEQESVGSIIDKATEIRSRLEEKHQLTQAEQVKAGLLRNDLSDIKLTTESDSPRLLIAGGMVDPINLANLVSGLDNADENTILLDLLSFSYKVVFTPNVESDGDSYSSIAKSLLHAPSEPTQEGLSQRTSNLDQMLKSLKIDGIVICEQSFCEPDEFEAPSLARVAESVGIPSLRFPLDPEMSDKGRLEVRLQTFLETIEEVKKNE